MTIIIEEQHPGESTLLWKLGNMTAVDSDNVMSFGLAWIFKEDGKWNFVPRITGNVSLFYNALLFIRLTTTPMLAIIQTIIALLLSGIMSVSIWWMLSPLLLGLFWSVRWGSSIDKKSLFQTGFGWKLNGRLGLLFRIQSDKTSAEGVTGPNYGQAQGFEYGTH